jgi:thymidylate kinase
MLLILEGVNGVGKSTYAERIVKAVGAVTYRAFRRKSTCHFDSDYVEKLREEYLIPVNTHVDELYMADTLASFTPSNLVIFDRSMPSAIAYGMALHQNDDWYNKPGVSKKLLNFWLELLRPNYNILHYFQLISSYEEIKYRCNGRWHPNKKQYAILSSIYDKVFREIPFKKQKIHTDRISLDDGVKCVLNMVKNANA